MVHLPVFTFTAHIQYKRIQKDKPVTFTCGNLTEGSVMWSRDRDGEREDIGEIKNGFINRSNDPIKNYNNKGLSLMISLVSPFYAGLYYCNSTAVACLTVISGPNVTDTCENADLKTRKSWAGLAVVGSVLIAVVSVFTWRWFSRKNIKVEDEEVPEHVYASIDYKISDKAETGGCRRQKEQEDIYYLATHPDPGPTGLLNDPTYSLIQNPVNTRQKADPDGEGLYSLAQRPSSTAEDPQTSKTDS
ncbi:uncharacterized protein LOC125790027 [Astyanax mexicanus]|uniref:uncharacterized protein LOC125790027 n=1 Tax=Astyanax mexicanus TaxID=7994 RepID=UPI0020CB0E6D|nr:uncharacterized protein LOC125790027 [Astyanax mexicanus]